MKSLCLEFRIHRKYRINTSCWLPANHWYICVFWNPIITLRPCRVSCNGCSVFYCKNSERRWLTVPARKTAWFCTRSADRRIALSCPSPVPQHPKFICFPSLRSALPHFRTKFQFFCRKDLHCPAFSAIIHVVADADVAQSVERILGKDEVAGSNPAISSTKYHLPL